MPARSSSPLCHRAGSTYSPPPVLPLSSCVFFACFLLRFVISCSLAVFFVFFMCFLLRYVDCCSWLLLSLPCLLFSSRVFYSAVSPTAPVSSVFLHDSAVFFVFFASFSSPLHAVVVPLRRFPPHSRFPPSLPPFPSSVSTPTPPHPPPPETWVTALSGSFPFSFPLPFRLPSRRRRG